MINRPILSIHACIVLVIGLSLFQAPHISLKCASAIFYALAIGVGTAAIYDEKIKQYFLIYCLFSDPIVNHRTKRHGRRKAFITLINFSALSLRIPVRSFAIYLLEALSLCID